MKKDMKTKEKTKGSLKIRVCVCALVILILLFIFSTCFALVNITNSNIINNVRINGIDASNLSKNEAISKLQNIVNDEENKNIILKYNDENFTINLAELNINYEIENAVENAQSIGRNNNIFVNNYNIIKTLISAEEIKMNITVDENILNQKIEDFSKLIPGSVEESSYYIEDNELFITKGKSGISVKKDELKNLILEKMKNINEKTQVIDVPTIQKDPEPIDLDKIYNEIHKEPENAYVTQNPLKVHPNINGIDFAISMDEAKKILEEEKEEYAIPLKITIADITLIDLGEEAFPNVLGTFTTRYDASNKNRTNNIMLASDKINGTVIMPGETFSYNKILGKRTIQAGYKEAGAYAGGKVVQEVGGGICQVSSTLYNAVLYANLEIVERSSHYFETSYVDASRDATVSWGTVDFKFKNNRNEPIRIEANSKSGVCTISIKGIYTEKEYEVVIQSKITSYIDQTVQYEEDDTLESGQEVVVQGGHSGCTSEAYKILKLNGNIVSTTLLSKDSYHALNKIIKIGTKPSETENEEENKLEEQTKQENNTVDENVQENEIRD